MASSLFYIALFIILAVIIGISYFRARNNFKYQLAMIVAGMIWRKLKQWWLKPGHFCKTINGSVMMITYSRGSENFALRIPYCRKLSGKMTNHKVMAYFTNVENEVIRIEDITQQNGIPYLITPEMLGASYFVVSKLPSINLNNKYNNTINNDTSNNSTFNNNTTNNERLEPLGSLKPLGSGVHFNEINSTYIIDKSSLIPLHIFD